MTGVDTNRVITGDAFDVLVGMPDDSVHMCMTSPPYWQLRDYGEDGQLGLEETPEEYVENVASVMDEVHRVLRPDGSLWLNLGDTYDDKDLQQIPARVALELQSRGWVLRNRVTWAKPNPMPQSVKDRLNDTTEAIFHLTPSKSYWYDLDAIREAHADASIERKQSDAPTYAYARNADPVQTMRNDHDEDMNYHPAGKNPGDVFEVTTKPFPDAHFAVYPPELCEKPIKATCPPDGIALDPFAGAGTTLLKAKDLGRKFIGIELNPEYADMARSRIGLAPQNPSNVRDDAEAGLEEYTD